MRKRHGLFAALITLIILLGLFSPSAAQAAAPVQLPVTGQTTGYAPGDDGYLQKGLGWSDPRFTASGGTVQDNFTGLIWAQDAGVNGGNGCTSGVRTWQGALDYVACLNSGAGYLGYNDWVLPNINELRSLLSLEESNPTLPAGHPFTALWPGFYWTATTSALDANNAWIVDLSDGYLAGDTLKSQAYHVLPLRAMTATAEISLARTGQTTSYAGGDDGALPRGASAAPPRYVDKADGTIMDTQTYLVWAQDANTAGPDACALLELNVDKGWLGALEFVDCLNTNRYLGQNDWRLPNYNELTSLINYGEANPSLDLTHPFTLPISNSFWTSTTYALESTTQWFVDIDSGEVLPNIISNHAVWPVRDAVWTLTVNKTGNGIVIPDIVDLTWVGNTGTAIFNHGTVVTLSPVADADSRFTGWGGACSGTGSCIVTMEEAKEVTATFALNAATGATLTANIPSPYTVTGLITFTGGATGGDAGPYEYRFRYRSAVAGTPWTMGQDYSASTTWTWDTAAITAGAYQIVLDVRHVGAVVAFEAEKVIAYNLSATGPATSVTLSPNLASPRPAGTVITFTGKAVGGDYFPYEYRFYYRPAAATTYTLGRDYAASATWIWDTTALALPMGIYYVAVEVRHVGSALTKEARLAVVYNLGSAAPATAVSVTPTLASPQPTGMTIPFNALASGGDAEPYEYRFWWRSTAVAGTPWTLDQDYSLSANWNWDTTGLPMGGYQIRLDVRHAGSPVNLEAQKVVNYTLGSAAPATAVSLIPTVSSPQAPGTAITFNALASGGDAGPYQYRFWWRNTAVAGTAWTLAQNYSLNAAWNWNTAARPAGDYQVRLDVRHEGSLVNLEAQRVVSYTLAP